MSIVNRSLIATGSGVLVSVVNVEIVPDAVPADTVGAALNTDAPFFLIVNVNAVAGSLALVTTTHFVSEPACGAGSIGPTLVPTVPF